MTNEKFEMRNGKSYGDLVAGILLFTLKLGLSTSILRHARVDVIRPGRDAACEIQKFTSKPRTLERFNGLRTTAAHLAMHHGLARRIDLCHSVQNLGQRNMN